MEGETGKHVNLFARFMELVGRARRMKDQSKGAGPDSAALAEWEGMAREAMSLMPDDLRGLATQFKQAATHARRVVELLADSPPNVRDSKHELAGARGRVAGGIANTILPAISGNSTLSRNQLVEILQTASQAMQQSKDLMGELSAEPMDIATIREKAAALSRVLQALATRADVPEAGQDHR